MSNCMIACNMFTRMKGILQWVREGQKAKVRRIENYMTSDSDIPINPIIIVDAGELSPNDPFLTQPVVASDGDSYEDYPEDDLYDTQDPKVVSEVASTLCKLGNTCWKENVAANTLTKWQKVLRYLDVHHDTLEDLADEFIALHTPLLLAEGVVLPRCAPQHAEGSRR
ncbi:hypothetical protein BGY98DRAFT_936388 [Russula aff. rugulosa BPL654]|nr:hypothetical protein BGY98DRAFT_936388 [Russula aff. rugulosa BPL654]